MIEARNLRRSWGAFALRDVSLRVAPGEYLAVLGPCGAGKTLLLETLAGLHEPQSGSVLIDGRDATRLPPERRRVGLVYQQYALFPHLSVRENIAYGLRYLRWDAARRRARVEEMVDLLDIRALAGRPSPEGLSGGESQKVALARALAVAPAALLLDEPLSSLDHQAAERVTALLARLAAETRVPVIHVTHDYAEAAALAGRVIVLRDGAVAQSGAVEEVFWRPADRFVAGFLGVENVLDALVLHSGDGEAEVEAAGVRLRVQAAALPPGPAAVCVRPEDVRLGAPAGENTVTCRVIEIADRKFSLRVRLKFGTGEMLAIVPKPVFAALQAGAGDEVAVHLPPDRIHLMAAPAEEAGHAV